MPDSSANAVKRSGARIRHQIRRAFRERIAHLYFRSVRQHDRYLGERVFESGAFNQTASGKRIDADRDCLDRGSFADRPTTPEGNEIWLGHISVVVSRREVVYDFGRSAGPGPDLGLVVTS